MDRDTKIQLLKQSFWAGFRDRLILRYRPLFGHLWLTRACNLNCRYCYITSNNDKFISSEVAKEAVSAFWRLGVRIVGLMGGEPTLHPELPAIISMLSERGITTYLSTNGFGLNENNLNSLITAGLDIVDLSLDSVSENQLSDKSVHRLSEVIDALDALSKKRKVAFKVNTVFNARTWQDSLDVVEYCISRKIRVSVGLACQPSFDRQELPWAKPLRGEEQQAKQAGNHLTQLRRSFPEIMVDPLAYFKGIEKRLEGRLPRWSCSVGTTIMQVDWDGKIFECSKLLRHSNLTVHDITPQSFSNLMKKFRRKSVPRCNPSCYSNCAFNLSYFRRHPIPLILLLQNSYHFNA